MEEARSHEIVGYSVWPYTNTHSHEPVHVLERSRRYIYAFKNGRAYRSGTRQIEFEAIVADLVVRARDCPAFESQSLLVPIPRSGRSERSFDARAEEYPCRVLAEALARALPGGHRVAEVFTRRRPLPPSSSAGRRHTLDEHARSLALDRRALDARSIVLIDDLVTKGTQSMACAVMLREAGFTGTIAGFYVGQAVHWKQSILQQQPYLVHAIAYTEGDDYPRRTEESAWRDCPSTVLRILDSHEAQL